MEQHCGPAHQRLDARSPQDAQLQAGRQVQPADTSQQADSGGPPADAPGGSAQSFGLARANLSRPWHGRGVRTIRRMLEPHPAIRRTDARWLAALAGLPWLTACAPADSEVGGLWWFATAALLLVAALAFALGRLLERQHGSRELREARAALHRLESLQDGWHWLTDAQHRLLAWQGPGRAPGRQCAFFQPSGAGDLLVEQLRSQRPFGPLRLSLAVGQDGARTWLLSGVPQRDDRGGFCGYAGRAEPVDTAEAQQAAAAAVEPLLAACPAPALLAAQCEAGWQVRQANAAALAQWPGLAPGVALADVLGAAPAPVLQAWDSLPTGEVREVHGWRLALYGPLPDGGRGLLLSLPAAPGAAQATAESDQFSFTVSHDLRAPIRVVEGFTRIVKEDYGHQLDRVGNDHLDRVLGAAARMNQMIDALLTLARLSQQPLARQPVNLSQLAGFVIDDLRRGTPERAADIDIEAGLVAQGDPTLLRLVLENLLGNAWKYSARSLRAQIALRRVVHGTGWAYVVRDNGAGFDMRESDRLFGLFQRLHSTSDFPGTGVGLASVRRIVQRHGGDIWAEAEVGRGAAFYFTLAA